MKTKSLFLLFSTLFLISFNSCEDSKELSDENLRIAKASTKTPPIDWESDYEDEENGNSDSYIYSGSTVYFPQESTFSNSFKDGLITVVVTYNASSYDNKPLISGVSFKNSTPSLTTYKAEEKVVHSIIYDANKNLLEFKIRVVYSITTKSFGGGTQTDYREYNLNFVRSN